MLAASIKHSEFLAHIHSFTEDKRKRGTQDDAAGRDHLAGRPLGLLTVRSCGEAAPTAIFLRVRRRRRLQQDQLQEDGDPGRQGCCHWLVHDRAARRSNPDNQLHGRPRQRVRRRGLLLGGAGLPTRAQGGLRAPSTPSLYTPQKELSSDNLKKTEISLPAPKTSYYFSIDNTVQLFNLIIILFITTTLY